METFRAFVRDAVVIGYMFVLRIGVPLLITLLLGSGLRKLLEEKQEAPEPTPAEEPAPSSSLRSNPLLAETVAPHSAEKRN